MVVGSLVISILDENIFYWALKVHDVIIIE